MISRLVRYWLEMLPGTRTGPRSARVPRHGGGQMPVVGRFACARRALAQRIDQVLVRPVAHGDVAVDRRWHPAAAPRMASIRRVVTALCPTSSSMRPGANSPPRPVMRTASVGGIVDGDAEPAQAVLHAPVVVGTHRDNGWCWCRRPAPRWRSHAASATCCRAAGFRNETSPAARARDREMDTDRAAERRSCKCGCPINPGWAGPLRRSRVRADPCRA